MKDLARHAARTHTFIQAAFVLAFVWLGLEVLLRLKPLMIAVGAAFVLAYLLDPLVVGLQRRRVPRLAAVTLVLGAVGAALTAAVAVIVPLVSAQLEEFSAHVPDRMATIGVWIEENTGQTAGLLWEELQAEVAARLSSGEIRELMGSLSGGLESVSRFLVVVGLVPIFTVYLLIDFPRMIRFMGSLVPPRSRKEVFGVAREISDVLAMWVRGELVLMVTLSALYTLGLVIVGAPLAVVVGFTTGMLAFIPYIGPGTGLLLGLVVAGLDFQGWGPIVGILGVFALVQTLDAVVITPRILGGSVGLNPAAVIAGLMVCGTLFGLGGVMIAVPLTASVVVLVRQLVRSYRRSRFFVEGSEGVAHDGGAGASMSAMASMVGGTPDLPHETGEAARD